MPRKKITERVTEVLNGEDTEFKTQLREIRSRVWYQRWEAFANFLKGNSSDAEILRYAHRLIDYANGYGYEHVAVGSCKAMELAIKDTGLK